MKLKRNMSVAVIALSLLAGVALAANSTDTSSGDTTTGPGYGMMDGQGPYYYGMHNRHGKGMRGQGCLMNGGEAGMGQKGMMGQGLGMNRGAGMLDPALLEKRNQFLDATVDLRKRIHDKQFSYMEASRDSALTQGEFQNMGKELFALRQELQAERQKFFPIEQ
ncbi:MAG: hypothetical protein KJ804_09575 [Proteobacteria bacterium]|nr:hypothetical protein [Pseudomonadota bacterium]MBU1058550.1 hypothetical protein [Pseudomonadota bacterium]